MECVFLHQASYLAACQQVVDPLVEAARPLHVSKVWDDINCRLFTTFWSLSLYDLYVPAKRYDDEISRAKQAIKDLDSDQDMVSVLMEMHAPEIATRDF